MRDHTSVNPQEVMLGDETIILSTTDTRGHIKYVNDDFCSISGFKAGELMHQPHNIVRHPDMPASAFAKLWQQIAAGRSWMGLVKNRCKDGRFYWVDAYVVPVYEKGEIHEYQSVRRKASADCRSRAESLYAQICAGKHPAILKDPSLSLVNKVVLLACILTGLGIALANLFGWFALALLPLAFWVTRLLLAPLTRLASQARKVITDPVARAVYTGRRDEIGDLQLAIRFMTNETGGAMGRMADSTQTLASQSEELLHAIAQNAHRADGQRQQTEQAAAAVEELHVSFADVSEHTQLVVTDVELCQQVMSSGQIHLKEVSLAMAELEKQMALCDAVVQDIATDSKSINQVLDVIGGIAEQTNLLALNAAIEAARAGESGRGFAVVADEVRQLSARTCESTGKIESIVSSFHQSTTKAEASLGDSQQKLTKLSEQLGAVQRAFTELDASINTIRTLADQSAHAMTEQSLAAGSISDSLHSINSDAQAVLTQSRQAEQMGMRMSRLTDKTLGLSRQFWQKSLASNEIN